MFYHSFLDNENQVIETSTIANNNTIIGHIEEDNSINISDDIYDFFADFASELYNDYIPASYDYGVLHTPESETFIGSETPGDRKDAPGGVLRLAPTQIETGPTTDLPIEVAFNTIRLSENGCHQNQNENKPRSMALKTRDPRQATPEDKHDKITRQQQPDNQRNTNTEHEGPTKPIVVTLRKKHDPVQSTIEYEYIHSDEPEQPEDVEMPMHTDEIDEKPTGDRPDCTTTRPTTEGCESTRPTQPTGIQPKNKCGACGTTTTKLADNKHGIASIVVIKGSPLTQRNNQALATFDINATKHCQTFEKGHRYPYWNDKSFLIRLRHYVVHKIMDTFPYKQFKEANVPIKIELTDLEFETDTGKYTTSYPNNGEHAICETPKHVLIRKANRMTLYDAEYVVYVRTEMLFKASQADTMAQDDLKKSLLDVYRSESDYTILNKLVNSYIQYKATADEDLRILLTKRIYREQGRSAESTPLTQNFHRKALWTPRRPMTTTMTHGNNPSTSTWTGGPRPLSTRNGTQSSPAYRHPNHGSRHQLYGQQSNHFDHSKQLTTRNTDIRQQHRRRPGYFTQTTTQHQHHHYQPSQARDGTRYVTTGQTYQRPSQHQNQVPVRINTYNQKTEKTTGYRQIQKKPRLSEPKPENGTSSGNKPPRHTRNDTRRRFQRMKRTKEEEERNKQRVLFA